MSDLTDNTSELDSYGVWVKPQSSSSEPDNSFDIDLGLDELDSSIDNGLDSLDEVDLSDFDVPVDEVESPSDTNENVTDDIIPEAEDIFDIDSNAENTSGDSADDFQLPEEDGEISLDDFLDGGFSDESVASGNNGFAPGAEPSASQMGTETEEVSFDEFSDGEISLDDFLDGGDFTSGPAPEVKETKTEEIVDEKPLEMDISFDSSVESIATEDNIQEDESFDDEDTYEAASSEYSMSEAASHSTEVFGDTEEIDLSDFGIDADAEETPVTQDIEESKSKENVVDFDLCVSDEKLASAPVVNEVIDEPEVSEPVVSPAPVSEPVPTPAPVQENNQNNELLQQIINELSGMKAEINALKSNIEEMQTKQSSAIVSPEITIEEDIIDQEITEQDITEQDITEQDITEQDITEQDITEIEETSIDIPEASEENEESTGFFDNTDGDDTIALSGDELENMLSGVEISETPDEPAIEETVIDEPVIEETVEEPVIEDIVTEEPVLEDTPIEEAVIEDIVTEEPIIEENAIDEPAIEDILTEEPVTEEPVVIEENTSDDSSVGFFDDTDGDDTIALSGNELDNILSNVELSEPEEAVAETPLEEPMGEIEEMDSLEDIPEEIDIEPVPTETVEDDIFGAVEEEAFETEDNFSIIDDTGTDAVSAVSAIEDSEEALEEPNLDDLQNISFEEETEEALPDEITIEKTDEIDSILVESDKNDFMESVVDSTTEEPVEPVIEEDTLDSIETIDDIDSIDSVESIDSIESIDEIEPEATIEEEPEVTEVSDITTDETTDDFAETETVDDFEEFMKAEPTAEESLTESNIDYLNEDENLDIPVDEPTVEAEPETEDTFPSVDIFETTEPEEPVVEPEEPVIEETAVASSEIKTEVPDVTNDIVNDDLKKDIKSVLLYMDQLLENLPEDKIVEFAKSEEFSTYKKLFSELGLA